MKQKNCGKQQKKVLKIKFCSCSINKSWIQNRIWVKKAGYGSSHYTVINLWPKNKIILLSQTINGATFVPISETSFAKAERFLCAFRVGLKMAAR